MSWPRRVAAAAKLLDHRLQFGQLVLHVARRVPAAADEGRGRRGGRPSAAVPVVVAAGLFFISAPPGQAAGYVDSREAVTSISRGPLSAEEAAGRTSRVCSTAASGPRSWRTMAKRFVHRRRSIGFEFHDRHSFAFQMLRIASVIGNLGTYRGFPTSRFLIDLEFYWIPASCSYFASDDHGHGFDPGVARDLVVAQHHQVAAGAKRSSASRPPGSAG